MKLINPFKLIFGILAILGVIIVIYGVAIEDYQEESVKKVSCYDKYDNKIIGQTCLQEGTELGETTLTGFFILLSCIFCWGFSGAYGDFTSNFFGFETDN